MLEEKYIQIVSSYLRNFKQTDSQKYACACPYCGDSKKDKSKARGNFFIYEGRWVYHCYNCGTSKSIPTFLKEQSPSIYNDWLKDSFGKNKKIKRFAFDKVDGEEADINSFDYKFYKGLILLDNLSDDNPAKQYINNRKLPVQRKKELYYVKEFKKWVNSIVPDKFKSLEYDEPRIIIPFFDEAKKVVAFQGRSLKKNSKNKYITIKSGDSIPKIYGRNRVDASRPVYILEGAFDAMYINNAVADAGSGMKAAINKYKNRILVWDNEPRSEIIIDKMSKAIDNGENIVIWKPTNQYKDVNEMVLNGMSPQQIMNEMRERTFNGLQAKLELINYRRV